MSLNITPELVRELHELGQRANDAAIVLTSGGWEVHAVVDQVPYPMAFTAQDISLSLAAGIDYVEDLDGETIEAMLDGPLDDDTAAAMADGGGGEITYKIFHEDGDERLPGDADVAVAFSQNPLNDTEPWADAWWFNLDTARELIQAPHERDGHGNRESLWITAEGRYVLCVDTIWGVSDIFWYQLSPNEAAQWLYDAPEDRVVEHEDEPMLVTAARTARALTASITAPPTRRVATSDTTGYTVTDADHAITAFWAAAAISDLVRTRVLSDLRCTRADAAYALVRDADGNVSEAHRQLADIRPLSRRTLDDLLAPPSVIDPQDTP